MPDIETLGMWAGVAEGLDKAVENFNNIRLAREELRKENELFDIQKKKANLELKELEFTTSPDQIDILKRKNLAGVKMEEAKLLEKETEIDTGEKRIEQEQKFFKSLQDQMEAYQSGKDEGAGLNLPGFGGGDRQLPFDWEYKGDALTIKSPTRKGLTPYQEEGAEMTRRSNEAWLAGEEVEDMADPPRTREEAYWGLKGAGADPNEYDFSDLPTQKEAYGRPGKGLGRIGGLGTRAGAFKPEIPKRKKLGAAAPAEEAYSAEQEQMIADNITHYKRPREEVVAALKKKGKL